MSKYTSYDYEGKLANKKEQEYSTVKPSWTITRQGVDGRTLTRPSFLKGTVTINLPMTNKIIPDRTGTGNYNLMRNNFLQSQPKGRELIPFEIIRELQVQQEGVKIQFGDKAFKEMFQIRVPDVTDLQWIAEKQRLLATVNPATGNNWTEAELLIIKPLGRPQRTVPKEFNFGEIGATQQAMNTSLSEKLSVIDTAIAQGRLESKADLQAITLILNNVLGDVKGLEMISTIEMKNIKDAIDRMSIPKTLKEAGFSHRLFTRREYDQNKGAINIFILSSVAKQDINSPIKQLDENGLPLRVLDLSKLSSSTYFPPGDSKIRGDFIGFPAVYLDLEKKSLIHQNLAFTAILSGVDGGMLEGVPLDLSNKAVIK